jgi:hypothetical protein
MSETPKHRQWIGVGGVRSRPGTDATGKKLVEVHSAIEQPEQEMLTQTTYRLTGDSH